jgi:O-antigen/teichoic acid export membrane protein
VLAVGGALSGVVLAVWTGPVLERSLPAAAGIFAVAPFLVPVVLGTKWLAAVPLVEILAINGALMLFHSSICAVLIANGHPDRMTRTNGCSVAMLLILFGVLVPMYGIEGAAWAALVASALATPLYLAQVHRSFGVRASVFARAAMRPLAAALIMVGAVRLVLPDWSASMGVVESARWLITGIGCGVGVYGAAVLLLWTVAGRPSGAERVLLDRARQLLGRWRAGPAPAP